MSTWNPSAYDGSLPFMCYWKWMKGVQKYEAVLTICRVLLISFVWKGFENFFFKM